MDASLGYLFGVLSTLVILVIVRQINLNRRGRKLRARREEIHVLSYDLDRVRIPQLSEDLKFFEMLENHGTSGECDTWINYKIQSLKDSLAKATKDLKRLNDESFEVESEISKL